MGGGDKNESKVLFERGIRRCPLVRSSLGEFVRLLLTGV
jgi:hypothetical protein